MYYFKLHNKDYIFIHIPKTSGTSIQSVLKKKFTSYLDLSLPKTNNVSDTFGELGDFTGLKWAHAPYFYINQKLKIKNINYIVVVRNPYARMFSLFQHTIMRKDKDHPNLFVNNLILDTRTNFLKTFNIKCLEEFQRMGTNDMQKVFEFWLLFVGRNKKMIPNGNPNQNILPQDWWFFKDSKLPKKIDFFQQENLGVLEEFLGQTLVRKNKNRFDSNENYKKYYNDTTIEFVSNLDKWTINKFDYLF